MRKVKIDNKWVGRGEPCFVIAEIGSNHNRNLKQAKRLIDVAVRAKASAVKFQSFTVENWVSKDYNTFGRLSAKADIHKKLKRYELPYEMYRELNNYCRQKGIICFSSPSHLTDVKRLIDIGVPAFKFGSVQLTDHPTIRYAAKFKKPIILGTGASDLSEVREAVELIKAAGNNKIILLHCTTIYPAKIEQANLKVINTFKEVFPDLIIGYSDHTLEVITLPVAAVAMGACVIEKHITLGRSMKGPDHKFALEPEEFIAMVKAIRDLEKALGSRIKVKLAPEKKLARLGRRSLVAQRDIKKGEEIKEKDITTKRPGYGIAPKFLESVIGRTAKKNIAKDRVVKWSMVNES